MTNKSGPNFQDLVLLHKKDDSYEAISKRAGGTPKARAISSLVTDGFTRWPSTEMFNGLSRALNISKRELVLAAARTIGIDIEAENPNDLLLIGAKRLPIESQTILMDMSLELQAWYDGRREPLKEESNVLQFPQAKKEPRPRFERMAGNTETESIGKAEEARASKAGEESQERE